MKFLIEGDDPRVFEMEFVDEKMDDGTRVCGLCEPHKIAIEKIAENESWEIWTAYDVADLMARKEISLLEITDEELERMNSPGGFLDQAEEHIKSLRMELQKFRPA